MITSTFCRIAFCVTLLPMSVLAADKAETKQTSIDQKEKNGFGRFVTFKEGTLTLENNDGVLLVWKEIPAKIMAMKYDATANDYKTVPNATEALSQVKPGEYMMVGDKHSYIRIGARKDIVIGSFVSFKNDRLLVIGKNLPDGFTKRYGTTLQYSKFRDDVPVHESVDGGEYKLIGTANKVLRDVKEGTVITVHGVGDDNITLIQLGVPKK